MRNVSREEPEEPRTLYANNANNFSNMVVSMVSERPLRTQQDKLVAIMAANFAGQLMQLAISEDDGVSPGDISGFVERKKEEVLAALPEEKGNIGLRRHFFHMFEDIKKILIEAMNHAINGTEPGSPSHGRR